jgi:cold shock CspA family protein
VTDPARGIGRKGTGRKGTGRQGVVVAFDSAVGLGTIEGSDGVSYPFHCIEIADGSREIDVGTLVEFEPLGKFGRWEAAHIRS